MGTFFVKYEKNQKTENKQLKKQKKSGIMEQKV